MDIHQIRKEREEVPAGGMSDYEIAERLGISRARVFQIRQRAMKKLRKIAETDPGLQAAFEEISQ